MGSLIEEFRRREEAARAEADRLRARIEDWEIMATWLLDLIPQIPPGQS